jgi:hypothetical protein
VKDLPGLKILNILLIPFLFCACAVDRPPSGGPPDTTPLTITASNPVSGSLEVSTRIIRLVFSHPVGQEELQKAIFFSPDPGTYTVSVHGRVAIITLEQPLKPDSPLSLTLRNSLKSLYGNRHLERSWNLSFSSGSSIPKETIEGRIWTEQMTPAAEVTVMAYPVSGDPGYIKPEQIVQTASSGSFRFEYLSPGRHRIIAITDKNSNLLFEPEDEAFAVTPTAFVMAGQNNLALRLSQLNPATPQLLSCQAINNREIEITLNRPVATRNLSLSGFRLEPSGSGTPLPVLGLYSGSNREEERTFRLVTSPMNDQSSYRIVCTPDDKQSHSSELILPGNGHRDRYPALSVRILPADGTENAIPETLRPLSGSSAELQFNLPITVSSLDSAVSLMSFNKGMSRPLPVRISRIDSRTFSVQPAEGFRRETDYILRVRTGLIETLFGDRSGVSTVTESRFSTAGTQAYGDITGTGTAQDGSTVIIEARRSGTDIVQRQTIRPSKGIFSFAFRDMPPGSYTITGFTPSAASSVTSRALWNSGSVRPFIPCDPFTAVMLELREGWSVENVRLDIPEGHKTSEPRSKPSSTKK